MEPVAVSVDSLRRAASTLLGHLEDVSGPTVSIRYDYFWSTPPEHRLDLTSPPAEFTIGQLTDCQENLKRISEDESRATSYALVWLADLLRAVGETVVE